MYVFIVSLVVIGCVSGDQEYFRRLDSLRLEPECSSVGGMCTFAADCPVGHRAENGLCPVQQKEGVECCHGISTKETRCSKLGGMCLFEALCNDRYLVKRTTDCTDGHKCCIVTF